MSYGLYDLRLAEVLAEQHRAAGWRARIRTRRRHYSRERPSERSGEPGCIALRRPAHSGAAGNN